MRSTSTTYNLAGGQITFLANGDRAAPNNYMHVSALSNSVIHRLREVTVGESTNKPECGKCRDARIAARDRKIDISQAEEAEAEATAAKQRFLVANKLLSRCVAAKNLPLTIGAEKNVIMAPITKLTLPTAVVVHEEQSVRCVCVCVYGYNYVKLNAP